MHEDTQGSLWHIRYPVNGTDRFLIVATTRPETMLGDTAVAVNPRDSRYTDLMAAPSTLPLMNREIPIIFDELADPRVRHRRGEGHPRARSQRSEAGKRHNLPHIKVIGEDAHMTAEAGPTPDSIASKRASASSPISKNSG